MASSLMISTRYFFKRINTNSSQTFPQKIVEEGTFPNLSYEVSIILILKPDDDITRKKIRDQYPLCA